MSIPIPTGLFDILPHDPKEPWRCTYLWNYLERQIRDHAAAYACEEIRTPIFERTELFHRSVGDNTDIVSKEMYTFLDKGERSMSLRPEGTASVMRALVEKQLCAQQPHQRLFYIGPMFRYERPQSGRYRQHHQFGVEIIGSAEPAQDAELIELLYTLYERLGLQGLTVHLNSLGDATTRVAYRNALQDHLRPHLNEMSGDSQRRFETNPLRILDSKDENDKRLLQSAPSILDFLNDECRDHFATVQALLSHLKIPYAINPSLVRGLDYYTKTVFEVTSGALGAQNTIGGGGRYDGLLKQLGGPDLPLLGFGTGLERLLQTMLHQGVNIPERKRVCLYVIPLGQQPLFAAAALLKELRQLHVVCQMDMSGKRLKAAMQAASALGVQYTLVLGENELQTGRCELKEMATGNCTPIAINAIAQWAQEL